MSAKKDRKAKWQKEEIEKEIRKQEASHQGSRLDITPIINKMYEVGWTEHQVEEFIAVLEAKTNQAGKSFVRVKREQDQVPSYIR